MAHGLGYTSSDDQHEEGGDTDHAGLHVGARGDSDCDHPELSSH